MNVSCLFLLKNHDIFDIPSSGRLPAMIEQADTKESLSQRSSKTANVH
ncbi:hypothetical Protein YC6258_02018 [Gynuella sunshinyii YC6258]|uniref:Uncharacterized protein n=1 Tax=Gynuella sunshinyii YC6258 TaxID=1445510 RepID=A0A0C5VL06_9GAMM|nr:hypothetical Protein YC6258_02018 [Gynuella sunshinyii YC6258]